MTKTKVAFIIPSYDSFHITNIAVKSFQKFTGTYSCHYYIIENHPEYTYKSKIFSNDPDITFIHNPIQLTGSEANASALKVGINKAMSESYDYLFLCHNDVMAIHPRWLNFLISKSQKTKLVGTVKDPARKHALHISGLLVPVKHFFNILESHKRNVILSPIYEGGTQVLDVGDDITQVYREVYGDDSMCFCCKNTLNDPELCNNIDNTLKDFRVDRALNDYNEVIFLHLGRGTPKSWRTYTKPNRIYIDDWTNKAKELQII